MSRENVERFRRLIEALNRADVEAALRDVAEDVVVNALRSAVEGEYHGHDGVRAFFADNAETWELMQIDYTELRDLGDRVLAIGTLRVRGRGAGVETEVSTAGVATFAAGKMTRWEDFGDRRTVLGALGLSEEAMSRDNVETVRRLYDAVARRDAEGVLAFYDPVVVWESSETSVGKLMGPDVYRGHDGLRRMFREYYDAWENVEDTCEELIDAGEHVVSVVASRGRGRTSGVEVEWHPFGVWTIREGKVVRVAWFSSREEALESVGLRE
jgi:ketosteroid isomerase-like protein